MNGPYPSGGCRFTQSGGRSPLISVLGAALGFALWVGPAEGAGLVQDGRQDRPPLPSLAWTVSGGTMTAQVTDEAVQVRLVWRTAGQEGAARVRSSGSGTLQLGVLQWPGLDLVGLEVLVGGGGAAPVRELEPIREISDRTRVRERRWSVDLPAGDSLVILYAVRPLRAFGAVARVRIPVVLVEADPPASAPEVFTAHIDVAAGWTVRGGFPSGLAVEPGPRGTLVRASLPVLPRTVDLDLTRGELGPLGRTTPVEAAALLLIVCASAWGWRRLTAAD